jgi:hypothetical protein
MDEKDAHVTWAEVKENNSKAKTSRLSRVVQGQLHYIPSSTSALANNNNSNQKLGTTGASVA